MKVSVALCTYNGEKYITDQLNSILSQSRKVDEIIVCDDRSTDSTIKIIKQLGYKYPGIIKTHINEQQLGSVKNFEKAISLTTGDVIFLSDQDDIWANFKVEKYLSFFDKHPKINTLASNGYCIDDNSNKINNYTIWDAILFLKENNIPFNYYDLITCTGNFVTGASLAIKKEVKEYIFPFPKIKNFHHDEWIALNATKNKTFEMLDEKLFYYRLHSNQQVGGVSYPKTEKKKESLTLMYNIENDESFKGLKRRLKRFKKNYSKNIVFQNETEIHKEFFKEVSDNVKEKFKLTKNKITANYPNLYLLLKTADLFLNKKRNID